MIGPTLYDVLGAEPSASQDALHRAFRERARATHPDHGGGGGGCTAGMVAINTAWETLRDPQRRKAYDESLEPVAAGPVEPEYYSTREVRMWRRLVVAAVLLWSVVMAVFSVIAISQSGW